MIKKQIIIKNVFLLLSLFLFFSCDTNTTIPPADQTDFSAGADLVKGISISSYKQQLYI